MQTTYQSGHVSSLHSCPTRKLAQSAFMVSSAGTGAVQETGLRYDMVRFLSSSLIRF